MGVVLPRDGIDLEPGRSGGTMTAFLRKLSWFLKRRSKEAELQEEIQFHLDEEAEEHQVEGLAGDQAERMARRDLGNIALTAEGYARGVDMDAVGAARVHGRTRP